MLFLGMQQKINCGQMFALLGHVYCFRLLIKAKNSEYEQKRQQFDQNQYFCKQTQEQHGTHLCAKF